MWAPRSSFEPAVHFALVPKWTRAPVAGAASGQADFGGAGPAVAAAAIQKTN